MRPCQAPLCQGSISARDVGLYPNPTNVDGKDSRVRLRTSSRTIGEDLKPKPNPEKETKERNLEKVKKENLPGSNYKIPKTHRSACDNPTNCARWQFVANFIIPLPFIAQHVIDKKLVSSLTQLSFLLVRFKLYRDVMRPIQKPLANVVHFACTNKWRNKGWTAQSRPPQKKETEPILRLGASRPE